MFDALSEYDSGAGEPLVLLHGITCNWRIWKPLIPFLESDFRVLVPTLPGHFGGEPVRELPATVGGVADQLCDWLDSKGFGRAHFVGNSLGGWLSLEMCRRGRASSVCAFSPAGAWRDSADMDALLRPMRLGYRFRHMLLLAAPLLVFSGFRKRLLANTVENGHRYSYSEVMDMLHSLRHCRVLPDLLDSIQTGGGFKVFDTGETPVAIIWSEHDRVIPWERYGKPYTELLPAATWQILGSVGHMPMIDNPAAMAQIIHGQVATTN